MSEDLREDTALPSKPASQEPISLSELPNRLWSETRRHPYHAALLTGLAAALMWAYWPTFQTMAAKWAHDPQYSHGYLVPLFCIALLWLRRDRLDVQKLRPNWWGLAVLTGGLGLRYMGAHYYLEWFDFLSLIPVGFGIALLVGGGAAVRWSWPAVAFLFFMLPLPHSLEVMLRDPLRRAGTIASTYLMQTLGLPSLAEGNVIVVGDVRIGVVEACSGLRMLMVFFALSTAVAILSARPHWERGVIVASALPIALISNVARITLTGTLHVTLGGKTIFGMSGTEFANHVFHDWAGWLMMPLALSLLWLELWFLSHLFITEEERPLTAGLEDAENVTEASTEDTDIPLPVGR